MGTNLTRDRLVRLPQLVPGSVLRARTVATAPGGKAVNVLRAARALGGSPTLLANCPGEHGERLADELRAAGHDVVPVRTRGELRSATVLLEDGGRTTVVNEPGPPLDDAGVADLVARYGEVLTALVPPVVVLSGSLPPGAPDGLYADLVRLGSTSGATTVVDVGGPALAAALAAGPSLVKPNLAEAESVLAAAARGPAGPGPAAVESVDDGRDDVPARCVAAAEALVAAGARAALVSGGRAGAALHSPDGSWWLAAPDVETVNPVGAGDALVAGVAVALERGEPLPEAVRFGVAVAADSVRRVEPAAVDPAAVAELMAAVRVSAAARSAT